MQQGRPPVTYQDWLNELNNATKDEDMVKSAAEAARRAPNKKAAFHDVALVLTNMYDRQIKLAAGNRIVIRNVEAKFDRVCQLLFKIDMSKTIDYVIKNEPNFDRQASQATLEGKTPPGYIDPPKGKGGLGYLDN